MNIEKLKLKLEAVKDDGKSIQMSAYMRNLFPFLGVQKTPLRKVISEFVREDKSVLDWEIVKALWDEEYREYQYVAMDYINVRKKLLTEADFEILYELIITKSWWDIYRIVQKSVELRFWNGAQMRICGLGGLRLFANGVLRKKLILSY